MNKLNVINQLAANFESWSDRANAIENTDHIHVEWKPCQGRVRLSSRNSVRKSLSISYGKLTSVSQAGFEDN